MTQPLKNYNGTLAEFAADDHMNVVNMPQSLPVPALNSAGVPVLIDRTVGLAAESKLISDTNTQARALVMHRCEQVSLVDRRGSIGLRGLVR